MKSDYVISAFRHFLNGDREEAIRVVRLIEACERSNANVNIASQIRRILEGCGQQLIKLPNAPKEISFMATSRALDTLIVADDVAASVSEIVREWSCRDALLDAGLPPRNILLLSGPSGNGKTSLAQAIATALNLPFGLVAYNEVIDSHLGNTAKGISKVLDFAATTPCLVLFDEADAIVTARTNGDSGATRECNLTVNQLLIKLDTFGTRSMVAFATNRDDVLDPAMKRRVHHAIRMDPPNQEQRSRMIELCRKKWPMIGEWVPDGEDSFAGIEASAMVAARRAVLAGVKA